MTQFSNFAGVKHDGQTREEFVSMMENYVAFVNKPTIKLLCTCKSCGFKSIEVPNVVDSYEIYFNTTKAQQKVALHALVNA
jgi:hypothetical protein